MPAVGLQRVVGQGAVRVDVDRPPAPPAAHRWFAPSWQAYLASISSPRSTAAGSNPDPVDLRQRPLHQVDLLRRDLPVPLRRRQMRAAPAATADPSCSSARSTPPPRGPAGPPLPTKEPQRRRQRPRQCGVAQLIGQLSLLRRADSLMIDQRQPVPEPLPALQKPHQPSVTVGLQPAVLDQLQQMLVTHGEGIERRVRTASASRGSTPVASRTQVDSNAFKA